MGGEAGLRPAKGYDGASLRAVAREAEVDPALVHHYFDGKADLFVAAMALPFDPRVIPMHEHPDVLSMASSSSISPGRMVITGFLTMWDHAEGTGSSFASCVAGMAASTNVADAMRGSSSPSASGRRVRSTKVRVTR